MKKIMPVLLMIMLFCITGASGKNLWAFLSYSTFQSPDGPYIETYLTVAGNSVKFVPAGEGKFQATVNIIMTFKQKEEIKAFKKYELRSPMIDDTSKIDFHFLDQQRFLLPNGDYDFEIQLADKNKDVASVPFLQQVSINLPMDKPGFSGIELIKNHQVAATEGVLTKSGRDLVPYVFTFYPPQEREMKFYCELYNMDKSVGPEQKFLLSYHLESYETGFKLADYGKIQKETSRPVNAILAVINIDKLASGNYNLVVEARNQANEIISSQKLFFQRSNPGIQLTLSEFTSLETGNTFVDKLNNVDSIREFINSTRPIATVLETQFMKGSVPTADLKMLQQFFYNFWLQRDPANPEKAWMAYMEQVKKVQYNFGTPVKKGYDTDRGRVFLEYGPPNTRSVVVDDPRKYPYEIWHYYELKKNQSNKRFVFYSPDLVTSDFYLLHSDALGEVYNSRWQIDLTSRTYQTLDIQDTQVINAWGDQAQDLWDLPN